MTLRHQGNNPGTIEQESVRAAQPVWTFGEGRNILLVLGFELQTVHAIA